MIKLTPYNFNTNNRNNISFSAAKRLLPDKQYRKRDIELISLDIDGTISDRRTNSVNPDVKSAIKSAIDKGIMVVLNSGRDDVEATIIARELDLTTPIISNYGKYIRQSGTLIYENPSNKVDLKGDSLEYLAKSLGIKKENIMSIGNDIEDVSMFKKSGTAVMVEGSSYLREIKPFAHYITESFNNSAVALIIKKLIK